MTTRTDSNPLARAADALQDGPLNYTRARAVDLALSELSSSAADAGRDDIACFAQALQSLLPNAADSGGWHDHPDSAALLLDFFRQAVGFLERAFDDEQCDPFDLVQQCSDERFADYRHFVIDQQSWPWDPRADDEANCPESEAPSDAPCASPEQLQAILEAVAASAESLPEDELLQEDELSRGPDDETGPPIDDFRELADPELREAYLDDAQRGVSAMEDLLLKYENQPDNLRPLKQICRELHTLKGASASVGLAGLAHELHQVEDRLHEHCRRPAADADISFLFACVDSVRARIGALRNGDAASADAANGEEQGAATAQSAAPPAEPCSADADTLRVKASQLDRLLDMLAELVMLRNRRDSRVSQMRKLHAELMRCVSRIRGQRLSGTWTPDAAHASTTAVAELASDLHEIARAVRDLCEPMAEENLAVSRFIGQFRQELTELRRLPIDGLFRRLQRAVRDAAHAEGKRVDVVVVGDDTSLDRSLLDRLYEPFLHVVRNAVSHGIESPQQRRENGKPDRGNIVMEARSSSNALVIEIRDDGHGLDYGAILRRGRQLGLITTDRPSSRDELAQLIFRPGFSTRAETTEVAGRGVGMDIVAATAERLRGWVEMESVPGQGSCLRMTIPLRSVIEHSMLVRWQGQLFGIPMAYVHRAAEQQSVVVEPTLAPAATVPMSRLFGSQEPAQPARGTCLFLGRHAPARTSAHGEPLDDRTALLVDSVVGPEEIVVRPLPALLRHQRLFSGISLAGNGEIVLLFDGKQLAECVARAQQAPFEDRDHSAPAPGDDSAPPQALVVDDSLSSRRVLQRLLTRHGFQVIEAADGIEALEQLRTKPSFSLVLTDLDMPRLGGLDLLREIKHQEHLRELPVVVVSGRSGDESRRRAMESGARAYLSKPVAEAVMTNLLDSLELEPATR
jgi:chemosensory pili system protein ChpA (sensor histidine kinase/response regulator)